ncbi:MAG TPA: flagellar biosynthesis protein FlhF [Pseudogracilibacillus sp.]|nr:flagellar biosynthesis protein FlhF [Pseudogracilibacillus sp.]
MKIKKIIARTMPEAMNKIKKELGPDAVILNSKEIKSGGIFGLFQKKNIEVIAALDKAPVPKNQKQSSSKEKHVRTSNRNYTHAHSESKVIEEIKQLQHLLETQSFQSKNNFPPLFEQAFTFLLHQGVIEKVAEKIIYQMMDHVNDQDVTKETITQRLKEAIEQYLHPYIDPGISYEKKVVQFVGPTGVGKTTTLAKVAALSMLEQSKKIAFITADTYRIAAIEQLKTYARILNVPVEVAYTIQDYKNALDKFSTYDFIFVDTAGRNFRDERYVKELKNMIDVDGYQMETYLVLSLTAKVEDVLETYEQFKQIPIEKVIFTKMDETGTFGSILNIGIGEQKAIAYLTNGQDVPDDIIHVDKQSISHLFVSRYNDV